MRIFLAGATGVLGVRLVPLLVDAGHVVAGLTRTQAKTQLLCGLGALPVVGDVYRPEALTQAVAEFEPDLVLHQLTDLPDDAALLASYRAANSRIRREGTRNLVHAMLAAGCERIVAQSVAWPLPGDGGRAVAEHEDTVLAAGGVVVRYGHLYGPGTFHATAQQAPTPRLAVDAAARRTLPALDAPTGVLVLVDE